jgi:hypothetical protein
MLFYFVGSCISCGRITCEMEVQKENINNNKKFEGSNGSNKDLPVTSGIYAYVYIHVYMIYICFMYMHGIKSKKRLCFLWLPIIRNLTSAKSSDLKTLKRLIFARRSKNRNKGLYF